MNDILNLVKQTPAFRSLLERKGFFIVDDTLGPGLLFSALYQERPANYVLLSNNQYSAQRLYEFLLNFLEEEQVMFFPSDELLRAETLSASRELMSQRLYVLGRIIADERPKILVTHPSAFLRYLPDPELFRSCVLRYRPGDRVSLRLLRAKLLEMGYEATNKVEHSLQFASRGDILDIYSVSALDPIRLEFFDDEIETIRSFDIQTQQSKKSLQEAVILPASDLLLSPQDIASFLSKAQADLREQVRSFSSYAPKTGELLESEVSAALDDFSSSNYRPEHYKYFSYASKKEYSVLDYFSPELVFLPNEEGFFDACSRLKEEAHAFYADLAASGRALSGLRAYRDEKDALSLASAVLGGSPFSENTEDVRFPVHRISSTGFSLSAIPLTIQSYLSVNKKVVVCLPDAHQHETVVGLLNENKIPFETTDGDILPKGALALSSRAISEGFEIPSLGIACLSSGELFRHRAVASRFVSRFKEATILRSYEELKPGDYVVHETKGIGKFLDIKTLEVEGMHRDYLHLEYADNQFLYVPLEQFRLVRKYAGREGASPKLSSISGKDWSKKKAKIRERINELADRLIALYGSRAREKGFCFPPDDELQKQFEDEFPYPLTSDQANAVAEIKRDMESPEIMDRLICGDVGFGKTEVAFRAVFKAISAGKQVALLCPTTLLCRQHYEVACERFRTFGIRIAMFSRLVPDKAQNENIEKIKRGEIDLAIGTHRLLSKDFSFKDLGLLVIDEEQRFGVEQKERIKEMSRDVDVLTLSATPIPRTLQMSLVGIRPISEINTAPSSRMPIQTYVTPFKQDVVDELIERELARSGQVYYIYNRVETIYGVAHKIAARIPGAEVGVVHGQMEKEEVEMVMERFYEGEVNVLVCTSIVENGIDVPNANMVIVENADRFGLSQLYQIKGRVGRGNRIAYAYLTYREKKEMNDDAKKRLQAIQEFTELGSGYKIAQRDLMIRGAGDMLGPEQAGFIDSVGLDLYLKLLNEAVEERKTGVPLLPPKESKMFAIDAYIPGEYASEEDKLSLYQELDDAKSEADVVRFSKKIRDIYGRIPDEVRLLMEKKKLDLLSDFEEFDEVKDFPNRLDIRMSAIFTSIDGIANALFEAVVPYLHSLKVSFYHKTLVLSVEKKADWLATAYKVMKATHKTYASMSHSS